MPSALTRTLWRESTGDSRCHRPHVMDCNLKWALIEYILTHYNPQFSYAWRKSRIMVWHGWSICPSVLPSIDIWLSTGVTTCPIDFNFIDIIHLVRPQVQDTGNGRCSSLNMCTLTQWLIFTFWSFVRPFFKLEPSGGFGTVGALNRPISMSPGLCDNCKILLLVIV